MTGQVPQQMTQELADRELPDVVHVKPVVQSEVLAPRTDRDPGDHGQLVALVAVPVDRRLPARSPGPQQGWNQEESGFVDEDEVGTQPRGLFFFARAQVSVFHRSIASSSRSIARRSGA